MKQPSLIVRAPSVKVNGDGHMIAEVMKWWVEQAIERGQDIEVDYNTCTGDGRKSLTCISVKVLPNQVQATWTRLR